MTENNKPKEIDSISGVETTGHEWDGLKELNKPAPRWWLLILYATIIWSVGYWVVYPAWPTLSGSTKGAYGWTQYTKLEAEQAEIIKRQEAFLKSFNQASFDDVMNDPQLHAFAVAGGKAMFKDNCATCHGTGAAGGKGYPNLNDDDWLWGGTIDAIYQTLQYGVRSGHDETRVSMMPAFGKDGILKPEEIRSVVKYVIGMNKGTNDESHPGYAIFQANCAACHGEAGEGNRDLGAPKLNDAIWLYGGDEASIYQTIYNARAGVMPFWKGRLDDATIRQLTIYVHSLGGGEATVQETEEIDDTATTNIESEEAVDANNGAGSGS
jgi:cytochrome c oxidase cbb3-type subunit 3